MSDSNTIGGDGQPCEHIVGFWMGIDEACLVRQTDDFKWAMDEMDEEFLFCPMCGVKLNDAAVNMASRH